MSTPFLLNSHAPSGAAGRGIGTWIAGSGSKVHLQVSSSSDGTTCQIGHFRAHTTRALSRRVAAGTRHQACQPTLLAARSRDAWSWSPAAASERGAMVAELDTADGAAWRTRYNAPKLADAKLAAADPSRGLAVSDHEGVTQLYAWDVRSGHLSRRTDEPVGKTSGSISADGSTIYYHADTEGPGSETGSFFAVPWSGGAAVDLTPNLPVRLTSTFSLATHFLIQI